MNTYFSLMGPFIGPALAASLLVSCAAMNPAAPPDAFRISNAGIGPVKLGMTAAQAAAELGPDYHLISPPTNSNLEIATCYRVLNAGKKEMMRFWVRDGSPSAGASPIVQIRTGEARFLTEHHIGAGSSIESLQKVWGPATLQMATDGLGPEQIRFEKQPDSLVFTVQGRGNVPAGIYEPLTADNLLLGRTTTQFVPESRIFTVTVRSISPSQQPSPPQSTVLVPTNADAVMAPSMRAGVNALSVE